MQSYTMAGGRKNRRGWIFLAVIAVLLIAAVILYTQGFFRSVVRRVGAVNPLIASAEERQRQKLRKISAHDLPVEGGEA